VPRFSISERRNAFDHNLPAISAAIVTGLPSFNLLKPHHGNPKANGDGVVRLPKFVVYAPKLLLTEPEVTSKSGQILQQQPQEGPLSSWFSCFSWPFVICL
jgi:hypothetical protein